MARGIGSPSRLPQKHCSTTFVASDLSLAAARLDSLSQWWRRWLRPSRLPLEHAPHTETTSCRLSRPSPLPPTHQYAHCASKCIPVASCRSCSHRNSTTPDLRYWTQRARRQTASTLVFRRLPTASDLLSLLATFTHTTRHDTQKPFVLDYTLPSTYPVICMQRIRTSNRFNSGAWIVKWRNRRDHTDVSSPLDVEGLFPPSLRDAIDRASALLKSTCSTSMRSLSLSFSSASDASEQRMCSYDPGCRFACLICGKTQIQQKWKRFSIHREIKRRGMLVLGR